ncbi:hypothetical protein J4401_05870 [Candidatus Woesearchaeota archaeon]|nr:hypothetical protein [Candidatus Woesearchaeota archaeon]
MFNRKAQAAMEFLMTYGWAILVVLVAIGALAYFGVLTPDKLLPYRCIGPAGFDCIEKASISTGTDTGGIALSNNYVEFTVKNNLGYNIVIRDQDSGPAYGGSVTSGNSFTWAGGGTAAPGTGHFTASTPPAGGVVPPAPTDIGSGGMTVAAGDLLKIRILASAVIPPGRFSGDFRIWYDNVYTGQKHPATFTITGRTN